MAFSSVAPPPRLPSSCETEKQDLETEKFRGSPSRKKWSSSLGSHGLGPIVEALRAPAQLQGPGQSAAGSEFLGALTWGRGRRDQLPFPTLPCFPDRTPWDEEPSVGWEVGGCCWTPGSRDRDSRLAHVQGQRQQALTHCPVGGLPRAGLAPPRARGHCYAGSPVLSVEQQGGAMLRVTSCLSFQNWAPHPSGGWWQQGGEHRRR